MPLGEEIAAGPGEGAAAGEERAQFSDAGLPDKFHEVANLFPLMDEEALAELAADIKENGLREPIWRHRDGRIIDGRNRWLACQKAGVECRPRTYEKGDETIVSFVVSKNLHRRHLTTAQRAAVAVEIANLGRGANQHTIKAPSNEGSTTQAHAAQMMGVSVASVERAAAVKRADPELHEKVKAGEMTAGEARAVIATAAPAEPEVEVHADEDPDVDSAPSDDNRAFEAITAVARLKISGTAAARDYEWTDADIRMAKKALTWLRMFVRVVERERHRDPSS
jgi:ParB-like chromosome segregation protein Spo0J